MAFRICDWTRYEPKEHKEGKAGPLRYIMWGVHGYAMTLGFRRLGRLAGDDVLSCYGLFGKLCELVGDQPRDFRDGIVRESRRGKPATIEDIADLILTTPERVEKLMSVLIENGWIEVVADEVGETAGACEQLRAPAGDCEQRNVAGAVTKPKPKPELELKPKPKRCEQLSENSSSDSIREENEEKTTVGNTTPHLGVKGVLAIRLRQALHVAPEPGKSDRGPAAKQTLADHTTIKRIVDHAVTASERDEAGRQADKILAVANSEEVQSAERRIARFVQLMKKRFPKLQFSNGGQH